MTTVAILGFGKMGQALATGLTGSKAFKVTALLRNARAADSFRSHFKKLSFTDNLKGILQKADIVVLCVKPHQAQDLCEQLAPNLKTSQILISICASVTTEDLSKWVQNRAQIVRVMPNTPCLIQQGMTVIARHSSLTKLASDEAQNIFSTLGKTLVVDEHLMDAATGLSGCGPAYAYLIIEALSDAGVKVGLSRKTATQMTAQMLLGSAQMLLERGVHPAELKDEVSTPSGCTVDGLMALEEGGLRSTLIRAVVAATERSKQLKKSLP
jgi:pyrroline-5-carboxylate reductase